MATSHTPTDSRTEHCPTCEESQPHEITIQLRTESDKSTNSEFSREPYRIATCRHCDSTTQTRMNNA